MQFFIFVLLICFLIFLFCLYLLSHDDFVLLRKDISIERVFNIALITAGFSLLGARIFYILLNPSSNYLSPLVFLIFPYFPGLSLTGGIIGAFVCLLALAKKDAKMPIGRILDFFSISFLAVLPFGLVGYFLLGKSKILSFNEAAFYVVLFIVFLKFLLPKLLSGQFKEGTISLIFLISFSLISLVEHFIIRIGKTFHFTIEDFILIFVFIASLVFLIIQEKLFTKLKKLRT